MSLFYEARFNRRFPITYLFVERLTGLLDGAEPSENVVSEAVAEALRTCGLCDRPSAADVAYAIGRLAADPEEANKQTGDGQDPDDKSFASGYLKWVRGLSPEQACMFVAEFNLEQAAKLYTEADKDDVAAMAELKVSREWEVVKVRFEAVLFGFGGGYGKGSEKGPEATEAELHELHEMLGL